MKRSAAIAIHIENLCKIYRHDMGIHNLTAKFESGYLNLVTGPNGSGKTTLLKCIMGLVRYTGSIERNEGRIGYAPEQYIMPGFLSVAEFLRLIGRVKSESRKRIDDFINCHLPIMDLSESLEKPIGQLSKGMRQKVNLLQALINNPRIVLLDEPLAGLDLESRNRTIELVSEISKTTLVIVSTHYPEHFRSRNRRIYEIANGRLTNNGVS
ncbi:MAG: ABC transporter ATP-binding protein [Bacilli bacterium]|nr:ABC transporter ATP-binding protein [Bacilli bacterium]MBN2696410.1 ABC transporter ATP-binding protein [Bacilli bacterium]